MPFTMQSCTCLLRSKSFWVPLDFPSKRTATLAIAEKNLQASTRRGREDYSIGYKRHTIGLRWQCYGQGWLCLPACGSNKMPNLQTGEQRIVTTNSPQMIIGMWLYLDFMDAAKAILPEKVHEIGESLGSRHFFQGFHSWMLVRFEESPDSLWSCHHLLFFVLCSCGCIILHLQGRAAGAGKFGQLV